MVGNINNGQHDPEALSALIDLINTGPLTKLELYAQGGYKPNELMPCSFNTQDFSMLTNSLLKNTQITNLLFNNWPFDQETNAVFAQWLLKNKSVSVLTIKLWATVDPNAPDDNSVFNASQKLLRAAAKNIIFDDFKLTTAFDTNYCSFTICNNSSLKQ